MCTKVFGAELRRYHIRRVLLKHCYGGIDTFDHVID